MKKVLTIIIFLFYCTQSLVFADDAAISNAFTYLKSQQDATGKITNGFSAPSQWSAIAFSANNVDITTIKKTDKSLRDFLLIDLPPNDNATDYENRILAIVDSGADPTNFGGTNYVAHLQGFYTNGQLGDTCSLNDDIFGLLALVASGTTADTTLKQNELHYLISQQDSSDGGFGFSNPGCAWYSTSADMTGAGVQALVTAKNNGLTNPQLDTAIEKAKNFILTNQNSDGGFGYFGSSDADTTGWVLLGLNALGLQTSDTAKKAQAYLLNQQSSTDGGFMAFDYSTNTLHSNSTTTAQSIIALLGKTWILRVFQPITGLTPTATPSATLTLSPTPSVTPTPTPHGGLTSVSQNTVLYQTITITTTPTPKKAKTTLLTKNTQSQKNTAVLGVTNTQHEQPTPPKTITTTVLAASTKNPTYLFIGLGLFFLSGFFLFKNKCKK